MTVGLEARVELAGAVLDSLRDWPSSAVRSLGTGLALDGGPLAGVGRALVDAAVDLDAGLPPGRVARLHLSVVLRLAAWAPGCDDLLERLEEANEPPWPTVRAALVELRDGGPS